MDKLRALVNERKALLARAESIAESMRAIPRDKHIKRDFTMVRVCDLTPEERSKIIRFENRSRS